MRNKIYFINPPSTIDLKEFHMGLALLSGILKKENYKVKVIDFMGNPDNFNERISKVIQENPKIIGITVKMDTLVAANEIALVLKENLKELTLIAGGAEVSIQGIDFLKNNPLFDIAVIGEAEKTIVELLNAIEDKSDLNNVDGICFRNNDGIVITQKREIVKDLDNLPFLDYETFDTKDKIADFPFSIFTSRGCPYSCIFCSSHIVWSRKYRYQSPERIIRELKYLIKKHKIKRFTISDDNFLIIKKRVIEFCYLMKKNNINLNWTVVGVRGDEVDYEIAKALAEGGCDALLIGIESADEEVLKKVEKGETIQQIERAIKYLRDAGIKVYGNFVIGLPHSTYQTEMKSIEFAERTKLDGAGFFAIDPEKGTGMREWADKYGTKLDSEIIQELKKRYVVNRGLHKMNFETPEFPLDDRIKIYYKANLRFCIRGFFDGSIKSLIAIIGLIWKYDRERFFKDSILLFKEIYQPSDEAEYSLVKSIKKKIINKIKQEKSNKGVGKTEYDKNKFLGKETN